ncbi:SIR2 family protein [Pseudomonas sp. PSE14]|uniref:SIR2 family protein n=1 Tax=Pseudomonas sp. PSE14 TaxID=3016341 RepID=UPI0023D86C2E|nr:SIR2 family protein [Pseudomonas sp. PSE14]WEJ71433.1 SIR2 family protein [Pseudomonas sp. PSE14]
MIDWPTGLVEAIARRRCVVMIGAGVSKNSENAQGKRPAAWEEFLRSCLQHIAGTEYVEELLERKDYLTACEIIKSKIGRDAFIDMVQAEYQRSGYQPAPIHKSIYELDVSIVASPNFDSIYDSYALGVSAGTLVVKTHVSEDIANYLHGGNTRLLLKTHGSANDPQSIIFTRKDYAEARTKYVLFYEILKSLALTHTFFFIGCGMDDPDIRMLFEDIQFAHGRMPFHYMTLPQGEAHQDLLAIASETMRIKFIQYSPESGHQELTDSLAELVERTDEYRGANLSLSQKW